jgi:hypothetical protein
MAGSHEWFSAGETFDTLYKAGLRDGELIKTLAQASGWGQRLRSIGFPQVTIGDNHSSFDDRKSTSIGHLWHYFCAAFWDDSGLLGQRSTLLECDWDYGSFAYRIERDDDDDRPACNVECFINFGRGSASYRLNAEEGESECEFVWTNLQFDRLGVEALARQWKRYGAANLLSYDETKQWLVSYTRQNSKDAWTEYKAEYGARAITKAAFEALCKEVWGIRPRGRPKRATV